MGKIYEGYFREGSLFIEGRKIPRSDYTDMSLLPLYKIEGGRRVNFGKTELEETAARQGADVIARFEGGSKPHTAKLVQINRVSDSARMLGLT